MYGNTSFRNVAVLDKHTETVWNVSWNPTGTILVSCGSDKTARVWGKEGNVSDNMSHYETSVDIAPSDCLPYTTVLDLYLSYRS